MRFPQTSQDAGAFTSGVFRVEERDDLVAEMAYALHDAKNMACALQAGLDWLEAAHATRTDTEVAGAIDELGQVVGQLSRILVEALNAARSGSSRLDMVLERVELGALALTALHRCRHRADIAGVRLVAEPCREIWCEIDRDLVLRVLDNLLDNALKVSLRGSAITIACGRHAERVAISVADEGPGISQEDQAKIFELFVASGSQGTGVGLAFCQRVAEAHGGRLGVVSGPGQGSTFVLSIPAAP